MGKECIAPADIQEGDLVAFLEGVAPVRVAGHITRCPACAAEVEELRLGDALFRRAFAPANYKLMTGQPPPTPAQILTLNQNRPFRLPWGFRGVTMRRMAAAVALVLLLMGLQIGLYNLFNRPADEAPTVTVQEGCCYGGGHG